MVWIKVDDVKIYIPVMNFIIGKICESFGMMLKAADIPIIFESNIQQGELPFTCSSQDRVVYNT